MPTSVEGLTITKPDSGLSAGASTSGPAGSAASLPFSGTWAAFTFWLGLLLLAIGIVVFWLGRRRSSFRPEPSRAPQAEHGSLVLAAG